MVFLGEYGWYVRAEDGKIYGPYATDTDALEQIHS